MKKTIFASVIGLLLSTSAYAQTAPTMPPSSNPIYGPIMGHDGFLLVNTSKSYSYNPAQRWVSGGWIFFWLFDTADYRTFNGAAYYVECASRTRFKVATATGTNSAELYNSMIIVPSYPITLATVPANAINIMASQWCADGGW